MHQFPLDPTQRNIWSNKVRGKNWTPSNNLVLGLVSHTLSSILPLPKHFTWVSLRSTSWVMATWWATKASRDWSLQHVPQFSHTCLRRLVCLQKRGSTQLPWEHQKSFRSNQIMLMQRKELVLSASLPPPCGCLSTAGVRHHHSCCCMLTLQET